MSKYQIGFVMAPISDQSILTSLARRQDDKEDLTQFSVACIHHVDDLNKLSLKTRVALFKGLSANDNLYLYKHRIAGLSWAYDIDYPAQKLDHYRDAYNKLNLSLPTLNYSKAFENKIWHSLSETFLKSKYDDNWNTACLKDKIDYLNKEAMSFMDHYDPENGIHRDKPFDKDLIWLGSKLFNEQDITNYNLGSFQPNIDMIIYTRYIAKHYDDEYIQRHKPINAIDMTATKLMQSDTSLLHKKNFDVDQTIDDLHVQYDEADDTIQLKTFIGTESSAKATLAHELVHLIAYRLFQCYQFYPKEVIEDYAYSELDFRIHIASIVGYTQGNENVEFYLKNKEEVLAHKIGKKFETEFNTRHITAQTL
jgi:hypothetical protein